MSKANRAFVRNEEAVSPVIGVILMVAITVVLAAVVFVLVSNLGKSSSSAPTFVVQRDDATDRLSVTSADSDADWNRLSIKTNSSANPNSPSFRLNSATGAGTAITEAGVEITGSADQMSAGEYLSFCADTAGTTNDYSFTLVDTSANSVIGSYNFNDLPLCV
jgi:archaeal type IV pilus assembly protein PilA